MATETGNLAQLQKYANDLSIIYQAEKEKARELEIYQLIFETAGIGIGLLDEKGRFFEVNQTLGSILEADHRDHFLDFVYPEDKEDMSTMLEHLVNENLERMAIERTLVRQNGRPIQTRIAINKAFTGKEVRLILVLEDITDRKRAETEMQNLANLMVQIQEDERARISQELHDDLGSDLFGVKLMLESGITRYAPEFKKTSEYHDAMRHLNQLMSKTRSIAHDLSHTSVEKLGLHEAIKLLTEKYSVPEKLEIQVDVDIEDFFPGGWNTNFYRIVQESLVNAIKHSGASHIFIEGRSDHKRLLFVIRDNGRGMLDEDFKKAGLGKALMQKRAMILGGELTFENLKPGLRVRLEVNEN